MERSAHLTTQLAASLRAAIREGSFVAGDLIPSERELMERHRLSRTTVRRAIQLLIDEELLQRVPGSGTYVSQPEAPRAASPLTLDALGLLVPTLANPLFGELSDAIAGEASARGYHLLVGRSEFEPATEEEHLTRYASNPGVRGVLAVPGASSISAASRQRLAERGIPMVLLVRGGERADCDAVSTDHVRGAQQLVEHLIGLGHRRIAYVRSSRPQDDSHIRGYELALREADIPLVPELIQTVEADAEQAGFLGAQALLQRGTAFSAIFARIDLTALGVLRALREAGLRVPEDVSVVGFDNTQLSAHLQPPLTTVDHTIAEIGRQAVQLLLDRVEGRYHGPPRRLIIQPGLVLRKSCAAPTN